MRLLASVLLTGAATVSQAGPTLDRIQQTGTITLAHRESPVPFSFLDGTGKPVGYAIDLCLRLVEAMRKQLRLSSIKVEYLQVTAATRIAAIAEGRAALECGSTTDNIERRQRVAFTVPHYIAGARYLVHADSTLTGLADFEHKTLVSTKGTTPLKAIEKANRERLMGIKVIEAADHAAAVDMVESGEAAGFAMDDVLLYGLISTRPDPAQGRGQVPDHRAAGHHAAARRPRTEEARRR